jgi:hypothetical protein
LHNAELSLVAVPGIPETNIQVLEAFMKERKVVKLGSCISCGGKADYLVSACKECYSKFSGLHEQLDTQVPDEYFLGFMQDPNLFLPEHFRTTWIDQANGVLAVMGKTRSDPAVEKCQEILFLKSKWQPNTVADWLKMHPDYATSAGSGVQSYGVEKLEEKDIENIAEKVVAKVSGKNSQEIEGLKSQLSEAKDKLTASEAELAEKKTRLTEAEGKLATAEGKLTEANNTVEKLKQLVPGVDLLANLPKLMPVSEALERLGRCDFPKMQERLSLGNQVQAQKVRREIFEVKQKYGVT